MEKQLDAIAVRRILRGDRDAFADLVRRYAGLVFSVAMGCGLRIEDAEDVTQDAFALAYRRLGTLRTPDSFRSWLCRITARRAQSVRGRREREEPADVMAMLVDTPDVDRGYEQFEREEDSKRILGDALSHLPDSLRLPFAMREIGGASIGDIAEALSITNEAVTQRVKRARDRIRAHLRRRGLEADAIDVLRSHGFALATVEEFLSRVMGHTEGASPAEPNIRRGVAYTQLTGVVLGIAAMVGSLGGIASLLTTPWGSLKSPAMTAATGATAGIQTHVQSGRRARVRMLVQPGEELKGWEALEPSRDSTTPVATGRMDGRSSVAMVANDFGIRKPLPWTQGEILLSVRVLATADETNAGIGFTFAGDSSGRSVLRKDETDSWLRYASGAEDELVRLGDMREEWRDVTLLYRTQSATYDLMLDGAVVARKEPFIAALAGLPVTGIYLASGRGDIGSPLLFSALRVTARENVSAVAGSRRATRGPANTLQDTITLLGGMFAQSSIDPLAPLVRVAPRAPIEGWVEVAIHNVHKPTASFTPVEVVTWGDHRTGAKGLGISPPRGDSRHVVQVARVAPERPGTYHIILAAAAETDAEYVASGTNWPVGAPLWNNGTDIAAWPVDRIGEAARQGYVVAPRLCVGPEPGTTTMEWLSVAVAAIKVVVANR